ncbi:hypothetical protein DFH27DRAFT_556219 [Peziza echinospora]|nr:hypothetical protein DFH27DRAFT_556219 [Peziza echinospora]
MMRLFGVCGLVVGFRATLFHLCAAGVRGWISTFRERMICVLRAGGASVGRRPKFRPAGLVMDNRMRWMMSFPC